MGLSLKSRNLKRYGEIGRLMLKYGHADMWSLPGLDETLPDDGASLAKGAGKVENLAADLEALGPTFVKIGQFLSTRADILPAPYLEALSRLQDRVKPFSFEEVQAIVAIELGVRISKGFATFDPEPLAAASLGQVHRATLHDGTPVAVKVQRPGIREGIVEDLETLEEIAAFLDAHTELGGRYGFARMLDEFRKSLLRELDYRLEAQNLAVMRANLDGFERILVPRAIDDYVTSRILAMELVSGLKITSLSPLGRMEIDGARLAGELCRAYLKQTLVDGVFHADPHPGNVFVTDDGRLALLDLGMVAHLTPGIQEKLLELLLAISEGRAEEATSLVIEIGERQPDFDGPELGRRVRDLVTRFQNAQLADIEFGKVMLEITRVAAACGIRAPSELTMLGKALLNIDIVARTLDPNFDPNAAIRSNAAEITRQKMIKNLSPGRLLGSLLEMREFVEKFPRKLNRVLDSVANGQLEVKLDDEDQATLMVALQKIANRITLGLLLAALIIGAAMLMRIETSFRIFGYPGLAILFFLVAASGALAMAAHIFVSDMRARAIESSHRRRVRSA